MLDIVTLAFAVQHELMSDNLNHLGFGGIRQHEGSLLGLEVARVLNGALDELLALEQLIGLRHDGGRYALLADEHDGVEMVRQAAQLAYLLSCDSQKGAFPSIAFESNPAGSGAIIRGEAA